MLQYHKEIEIQVSSWILSSRSVLISSCRSAYTVTPPLSLTSNAHWTSCGTRGFSTSSDLLKPCLIHTCYRQLFVRLELRPGTPLPFPVCSILSRHRPQSNFPQIRREIENPIARIRTTEGLVLTQPVENPGHPILTRQPNQSGQIQTHRRPPRSIGLLPPTFAIRQIALFLPLYIEVEWQAEVLPERPLAHIKHLCFSIVAAANQNFTILLRDCWDVIDTSSSAISETTTQRTSRG